MVTSELGNMAYRRPRGVQPFVIRKEKDELLLIYSPKNGAKFVDENFMQNNECNIAGGIFSFTKGDVKDLGSESIGSRTFILGTIESKDTDYYRLPGRLLSIEHDLLFYKDVEIDINWFFPYRLNCHLSFFQKVARMIDEEIIIGGRRENAIPLDCWKKVVKQFPRETEVAHYIEARVESILGEYLPSIKKGTSLLKQYLVKLRKNAPVANSIADWAAFDSYELNKYMFLCDLLEKMLKNEALYETEWEKLILRFVLLLYPQYIKVKRQLVIHERMTEAEKATKRQIDLALFDAEGHIDLIEIKRPSVGTIFRSGLDHDNNIPSLALSKTVMQIEKYILYLQKGGYELENELNKKYSDLLPNGTTIKIINPRGLIVFGRSNSLSNDQILDFEVFRRKFAHIADILTYDDLLLRFKNILSKFK